MTAAYTPQRRAERLIATGRMVLAVVLVLTVRLTPVALARPPIFDLALTWYVFYAMFLALLEWSLRAPLVRLRLLTHVFDLGIFALFVFFSEDPASPFLVYFVFSLLCATLRWRWVGVVATAVVAIAVFAGLGLYGRHVLEDAHFSSSPFIFRGVYLAVVAAMLAYIGAYEERVRGEMSKLAAWPRAVPWETPALARELLEYAVAVVGAPRALLTWEEPEEPWRHVASSSAGQFQLMREGLDTVDSVVAQSLQGASFLCSDVGVTTATVLHTSGGGLRWWRGQPLHSAFRERFAMRAVLALSVRGESAEGYLFLLDKDELTSDDLVLGEIVARQTAARMDHFYLSQRLRQVAAAEERVRVARDLHDGVLQSLAGTALQLETVRGLIDQAPEAARERIQEIQRLLSAEQRELREFIQDLRPAALGSPVARAGLADRLDELKGRIGRQWSLKVELSVAHLDARIADQLAYEIYRIVQEALVNAARHAHATTARVTVDAGGDEVRIDITDDGRGFAFRGRHDLAELQAMGVGPVSLRERIAAQGGSLVVDSSDGGSRLSIRLPLASVAS